MPKKGSVHGWKVLCLSAVSCLISCNMSFQCLTSQHCWYTTSLSLLLVYRHLVAVVGIQTSCYCCWYTDLVAVVCTDNLVLLLIYIHLVAVVDILNSWCCWYTDILVVLLVYKQLLAVLYLSLDSEQLYFPVRDSTKCWLPENGGGGG